VGQVLVNRLQVEYDAQVDWQPFLLHPKTPETGEEFTQEKREEIMVTLEQVSQIAQTHGMPFILPKRMICSRRSLEATEFAREQNKLFLFHKIVFRMLYGEGKDISEWNVLRSAALEAGLDPDMMQQLTGSGAYTKVIEERTTQAKELGINNIPAYVLNDNYAIMGVQPFEVFQLVLGQLSQGA
jgi:predicted DsbA family dithiol-disulfide isomerase